ncbi:MAG: glycosyltransferase family 1 protein [Bacteroidota bacterium]
MLRIGFDAKRLFYNLTGLGNYSRTLVRNLSAYHPDHHYYLYSPRLKRKPETTFFLNSPSFATREAPHRFHAFWRSYGLNQQLRRDQLQIFHGLSNELPRGLPRGIKGVVTIHDLIFKHRPDWYPWIDRNIYDLKFRHSCQRADHIIAISACTKADIIRHYAIPPEKISVIYQSCHPKFMQTLSDRRRKAACAKYGLPLDYILYVGSVIERKNLLGLLQGLRALPKDLRLPLVVIGKGGDYLKKVKAYIAANGMQASVFFPASFDGADLPALYQQARLLAYPSYYEGFGIPIIEALFSRTPVLTARAASLPEAGGPGAHYVDPASTEEMAEGLRRLISDDAYRAQLVEAGLAYVQRFDAERTAAAVIAVYESCME